ncbi:helix-turn-helix domain-containing protein [Pontibacter sp. 172403-2]|uniref:helix-turn-helix domain-containing protein n=1 Tax=Pontibacter rufus TaxID=2791028 RepID=UPI0018AF9105|nr:helix-turn-helix domain-containing protein [Pontibacter sp. 172403-2]MBF9254382.1 helix-turn-helix domain-containing protein [Pontibacter sp. 172403-2]
MNIRLIKTEEDYQLALQRLEDIFDAEPDTPEGDELEVLAFLIDSFEKEHFPIDAPDPIDAVKFRMEQLGIKQKDLAEVLGFKSRVSEVLNRKRKLTLEMIRNLHKRLNIPTNVLIQEY